MTIDTGAQMLRATKNDLIKRYAVRNNRIALKQTLSTSAPVSPAGSPPPNAQGAAPTN